MLSCNKIKLPSFIIVCTLKNLSSAKKFKNQIDHCLLTVEKIIQYVSLNWLQKFSSQVKLNQKDLERQAYLGFVQYNYL